MQYSCEITIIHVNCTLLLHIDYIYQQSVSLYKHKEKRTEGSHIIKNHCHLLLHLLRQLFDLLFKLLNLRGQLIAFRGQAFSFCLFLFDQLVGKLVFHLNIIEKSRFQKSKGILSHRIYKIFSNRIARHGIKKIVGGHTHNVGSNHPFHKLP